MVFLLVEIIYCHPLSSKYLHTSLIFPLLAPVLLTLHLYWYLWYTCSSNFSVGQQLCYSNACLVIYITFLIFAIFHVVILLVLSWPSACVSYCLFYTLAFIEEPQCEFILTCNKTKLQFCLWTQGCVLSYSSKKLELIWDRIQ